MSLKRNDFTMFKASKPWGYYPVDVEATIAKYEKTIKELADKNIDIKQKNLGLEQKVERLQEELKQMHFQMSSLELPETEEVIENYVLDGFKNYNSINNNDSNNEDNDEDVEEKPIKKNIGFKKSDSNNKYNSTNKDDTNKPSGSCGFTIVE